MRNLQIWRMSAYANRRSPSSELRYANTIRQLRFHHGEMTQKELAKFVGVSRQTICAIERGKYAPSLEVAFRTANVLCMSIEDVFYYELIMVGISDMPRHYRQRSGCSDAVL